jgi:hypothetical protein
MLKTQPAILLDDQKIAVICDHRSSYDVAQNRPFTGPMGETFLNQLRKADINVAACYLACCNDNQHEHVSVDDDGVVTNMLDLRVDLTNYQPNLILLVGRLSLRLAGIHKTLDVYRGSLFICDDSSSPFYGFKCLAVYPAKEAVRDTEKSVALQFDLRRAKRESSSPKLILPDLRLFPDLNYQDLMDKLKAIQPGMTISVDIEGGIPNPDSKKYPHTKGITCVGIATSPTEAFILNPWDFSETNAAALIREFGRIAADPKIYKILQNSLYDNFVFCWLWKVMLRSVVWDTMLSGWELFAEMPKSLEFQVSITTRWPYYKDEGGSGDKLTHYLYCLKDAAYTYEIAESHKRALKGPSLEHFRFNMRLLPAILYSELRGIRYRKNDAAQALAEVNSQLAIIQARIDAIVGKPLNVNSPKQCVEYLYNTLGYEKQYKKDYKNGKESLTADVNALLYLLKKYNSPQIILQILKYRTLDSLRETLEITTDEDDRVRCSYNVVGTDTGRLACQGSPTRSGANLQTITKKLRYLYCADEGYDFFECDLSGADGWTVAAMCHLAGDSTMLRDYDAGLKPAKIIGLMYNEFMEAMKRSKSAAANFRSEINKLSRDELRVMCDAFSTKGWLYDACKATQHGTNYAMKPPTMSANLLRQSYKKAGSPIYVSVKDCDILQKLYLSRYPGISAMHRNINGLLASVRKLTAASGNTRRFFGNPNDQVTQRAAYAHLPQHNTTYATKLALLRLWEDPENWRGGLPIIEPLHQIHDAIAGQWPVEMRDWAVRRVRTYFANEINIDGYKLIIPFEGHWGSDWGNMPNEI